MTRLARCVVGALGFVVVVTALMSGPADGQEVPLCGVVGGVPGDPAGCATTTTPPPSTDEPTSPTTQASSDLFVPPAGETQPPDNSDPALVVPGAGETSPGIDEGGSGTGSSSDEVPLDVEGPSESRATPASTSSDRHHAWWRLPLSLVGIVAIIVYVGVAEARDRRALAPLGLESPRA